MKYRDLLKELHDDGWLHIRTTGSHLHYKHPTKPGLVTVPAGGKLSHDIAPGTLRSILSPSYAPNRPKNYFPGKHRVCRFASGVGRVIFLKKPL